MVGRGDRNFASGDRVMFLQNEHGLGVKKGTPGLDTHGSYVVLSRHRDAMDLHYDRDEFASRDKLINTLSRNRA